MIIALLGWLLAGRQVNAETVKPPTPDALADSDGDGALDVADPNPFVAEVAWISWRIGPMTVGWKFNASMEELKTSLTEQEKAALSQHEFSFGRKLEAGAEFTTQAKAKLSFNPFELFGLKESGAEANFKTRFAASGDVAWSDTDRNRASDLTRLVSQTQIAQKLTDMNLEFTVFFYNFSDEDFVAENLQIPIKTGENVVTIAQYVGANGPETRIRIPAHRDLAIPLRFRANLDTTHSLALLKAMEKGSPKVSIEESPGSITSMNDGKMDAISALTQMQRKCCKLIVELDGEEFTWFVARRNAKTMKPLRLSDAFDALNAMAAHDGGGTAKKLFEHTDKYLRSAVGRDCSLLEPVRWWVVAPARGAAAEKDRDVNPSVELPNSVQLRERTGFPTDMKRWVPSGKGADAWALLVAGKLLFYGLGGISKDEKEAAELCQQAADLGDPGALVQMGRVHLNGWFGVPKDEKKAVDLWQKAAGLGDASALYHLGLAHLDGKAGLPKNEKKAVEYFQKAAGLDEASALYHLGHAHFNGWAGLPKDEKKAVGLWEQAADLNNARALAILGVAYLNGWFGLPKDEKKAVEYFQKAAGLDEASALYHLGQAHFNGWAGLPKDEKLAVELWQKVADLGDAGGLTLLGQAHFNGWAGLPKNEKKAVELWQKVADLGDAGGLTLLGHAHFNGWAGLPKDEKKAVGLWEQAADLNNARALGILGVAHLEGWAGLPKDEKKAVELLQQASDAGDANATSLLAEGYTNGRFGLPLDAKKGAELKIKAQKDAR